jgi:hypothetical protein
MAIQAFEDAKIMREYCRKLGRRGVAERIIELAQKIVSKEGAYQETLKCAGEIRMLTTGCKWDCYWDEKQMLGQQRMLEEAEYRQRADLFKENQKDDEEEDD